MTKKRLVGTSWRVIDGVEQLDDVAVTAEFDESNISGSSGCNNYQAKYEVTGARFRLLGPVAITRKMCPDLQMSVETEFLNQLTNTTSIRLNGDRLELTSDDGRILLVLRRISAEDLLGEWRVLSMHIPERKAIVSVSDDNLHLKFDRGFIQGNAGCNAFRGIWSLEGKTLRIGTLTTTAKECGEAAMTQEKALLNALSSVAGWRVIGDCLSLLRGDGGIALSLCRSSIDKPANATAREGQREYERRRQPNRN